MLGRRTLRRSPGSGPALEREVEDLLRTAVTDRLESGCRSARSCPAASIPGSSSFMAEALGRGVTITTVGFGEAAHNEIGAAGVTAARFETKHHVEIVQPQLDGVLGAHRRRIGFDRPTRLRCRRSTSPAWRGAMSPWS
jgi:hypothetical protein